MARSKGLLGIAQNFEPEIASAFDARANVPTKADLTIASNWTANDGGSYLYNGMTVTVAEDSTPSNNGIYILLDASNVTNINSWQQVGEDFPYTGSAQITGSLGVTGSSSFTENISVDTVTIGRRNSDVIVVGQDAGLRYSGSNSVFIGDYAGPVVNDVLGTLNTSIGYNSMRNTSGSLYDNYAIGGEALRYLKGEGARGALQTEAGYNTAVGSYNLLYTEYAQYNTAIGYGVAYQLNHGEIGTYPKVVKANTIIGDRSAFNILSGSQNTMIGSRVAFDFIRGSNNTFIGRQAGDGLLSGSRNTIIGYDIGPDRNPSIPREINDNIIFGGGSYINYRYDGSNTTIYGIGSTSANIALQVKNSADTSMFVVRNDGNVGIGTTSPSHTLDVSGSGRFTDVLTVQNIQITTGSEQFSTGVGYESLENASPSALGTSGFGYWALTNNIGSWSSGFGGAALYKNTGSFSNGFGVNALGENAQNYANGFGYDALQYNTGINSNGFGHQALKYNTGDNTIGIGKYALYQNTGNNSIGIGDEALYFNTGNNSIGIGQNALYDNTGSGAIGIGRNALYNNTGSNSTGIGDEALRNNTGNNSTGIGYNALRNNTGNNSTGIGYYALRNNSGNESNGFGFQALESNQGYRSNGFGYSALAANNGQYANGFGFQALESNSGEDVNGFGFGVLSSNRGDDVNGFGNSALSQNGGNGCSGFGKNTLYRNEGDYNTAMGHEAGVINFPTNALSGSYNTFLGAFSSPSTNFRIQHATAVGANITLSQDYTVILGQETETQIKVGIGTNTPSSKLHIKGAGTTSSTTALLVENNGGADLLKVTDDGTVTINDILTIPGQHPLPSSPPTGSFAVSSSSPPKPYFYDGTNWNALY